MAEAIEVFQHTSAWLQPVGLDRHKYWSPDEMNEAFFSEFADPDEFYVARLNGALAAAAIFQTKQILQDWSPVDGTSKPPALYIHYLAVERAFAGQDLPKELIHFASTLARSKNIPVLRLDGDADEPKLIKLYEDLGFRVVGRSYEEHGKVLLYERPVN